MKPTYNIKALALAQFEAEQTQTAVDAEVARLRSRSTRSIWWRLIDALPFTITWKTK